jgi:hypothetical protein
MTSKVTAALAAGLLAIGILVGAAGAIVVRDASTPGIAAHMDQMSGMMAMMGGSRMMGGALISPENHALHHPIATPEATR